MRGVRLGCAVLAGTFALVPAPAKADVFNLPIGLVGTFSDGTALTGQFSLNAYGFVADGSIETVLGHALDGTTAIQPYAYTADLTALFNTWTATPGGPPVGISAGIDGYILILTFEHSLGIPGLDPLVLDAAYSITPNSAEFYSWACSDYPNISNPARERLVVSGYAIVPEPASAALLGAGLLGLLAARRRAA